MNTYIEYDFNYIQTDYFDDEGDVKAIACIDAYPVNADGEQVADGYVVARVILSIHNDMIVIWSSCEGRLNPKVLNLVENAKQELEKLK